jgi:ATP-dependent RNA helicase RhlE
MNLKKINPNLLKALAENHLTDANELQEASFGTIKSGADCVLISPPGSGKTTSDRTECHPASRKGDR